jgi:hypothetical protein
MSVRSAASDAELEALLAALETTVDDGVGRDTEGACAVERSHAETARTRSHAALEGRLIKHDFVSRFVATSQTFRRPTAEHRANDDRGRRNIRSTGERIRCLSSDDVDHEFIAHFLDAVTTLCLVNAIAKSATTSVRKQSSITSR